MNKLIPTLILLMAQFAFAESNTDLLNRTDRDNTGFMPSSLIIAGKKFAFDQQALEQSLAATLKLYIETKDKNPQDAIRLQTLIAYGVIAAGQYGKQTSTLNRLLDQASATLGTTSLPAFATSPYVQVLGVASQCFKDTDGNYLDVDPSDIAPKTFRELIFFSRLQLKTRSH